MLNVGFCPVGCIGGSKIPNRNGSPAFAPLVVGGSHGMVSAPSWRSWFGLPEPERAGGLRRRAFDGVVLGGRQMAEMPIRRDRRDLRRHGQALLASERRLDRRSQPLRLLALPPFLLLDEFRHHLVGEQLQ